ncbi:MAG TPA: hypothetical protein VNX01_01645 [Bacteroidia bacterium]|jgi:hypothetical protein|nr:hypothetical protein [Bacteroidia bacterium]
MEAEETNTENKTAGTATDTSGTTPMLLLNPAQKIRGVKPGEKRGSYNKNKTQQVEDAHIIEDSHAAKLHAFTEQSTQEEVKTEQVPPPPPPPQPETKAEEIKEEPFIPKYNTVLFNGMFLLKIFNVIFPQLLKGVLVLFGVKKAKKLKTAALKLEEDEQEDFGDMADEVAPYIFGKIPPLALGGILFAYTYTRKAMRELDKIPDEE